MKRVARLLNMQSLAEFALASGSRLNAPRFRWCRQADSSRAAD